MSSIDSITESGDASEMLLAEERLEIYILDRQIAYRKRGIEAMIDFLKLDGDTWQNIYKRSSVPIMVTHGDVTLIKVRAYSSGESKEDRQPEGYTPPLPEVHYQLWYRLC